jgi:hypothetical protein
MKFTLFKTLTPALLATLACLITSTAHGQKITVDADEAEFEDYPSPQFDAGVAKKFRPKEWLEIEAKLNVTMDPEPPTKTCDRVLVKWYVLVDNPEKSGTYYMLTKDVEHVNIPLGEDVYCSVYLSPASVRRLLGTDKNGKKAVDRVGYEVIVNGVLKGGSSTKGKAGWWNVASPKVARTTAVPLLSKIETPFRNMWWDRYAEVSEDRR